MILDRFQRLVARSPLLVRLAVKVRNQCRCIIKYHLAESPNVAQTGEGWLRDLVARDGRFFVDVGANVGEWTMALRTAKGDANFLLLAFEPSQSAFQRLQAHVAGDARIEAFPCALGDAPGSLTFFEEAAAGKGSTLLPGFVRAVGVSREVEVSTLDEQIERHGWERVDLVKIDAEGYDLRVMLGAQRLLREGRIGIVQFEYNRPWQLAGDTLRGAFTLLEGHGYQVFLLKRDGLYRLNYALYEEYFEYSNFVGVSSTYMSLLAGAIRGTI